MDKKNIYKSAVAMYGYKAQLLKTIEECGELIVAISKNLNGVGVLGFDPISEEIADVEIMLEQLKTFGTSIAKRVAKVKEEKLLRLQNRIDKINKEEEEEKDTHFSVEDHVTIRKESYYVGFWTAAKPSIPDIKHSFDNVAEALLIKPTKDTQRIFKLGFNGKFKLLYLGDIITGEWRENG